MTAAFPVQGGQPTGLTVSGFPSAPPSTKDEILGLEPWTFVVVVTLVVLLAAACCCLLLCMLALYWAILGRRSKDAARGREHQAALLQQRQNLERQARERQQALQQQLALQQVQQIRERAAAPNIASMAEYAWIAGRRHERRKQRRVKRSARAKARRRRRLDALRLLSQPVQVPAIGDAGGASGAASATSIGAGSVFVPGAGLVRTPATLVMQPDGTLGPYNHALDNALQIAAGVSGGGGAPRWHPPNSRLPDWGDRCICPDSDVREQDILADGGMSRGRWTSQCEDCGGWRNGPRARAATTMAGGASTMGNTAAASAVRKQD